MKLHLIKILKKLLILIFTFILIKYLHYLMELIKLIKNYHKNNITLIKYLIFIIN